MRFRKSARIEGARFGDRGGRAGNVCVMAGALAFRGGAPVVVVEEGILHRPGYIITIGKKAE